MAGPAERGWFAGVALQLVAAVGSGRSSHRGLDRDAASAVLDLLTDPGDPGITQPAQPGRGRDQSQLLASPGSDHRVVEVGVENGARARAGRQRRTATRARHRRRGRRAPRPGRCRSIRTGGCTSASAALPTGQQGCRTPQGRRRSRPRAAARRGGGRRSSTTARSACSRRWCSTQVMAAPFREHTEGTYSQYVHPVRPWQAVGILGYVGLVTSVSRSPGPLC